MKKYRVPYKKRVPYITTNLKDLQRGLFEKHLKILIGKSELLVIIKNLQNGTQILVQHFMSMLNQYYCNVILI
jgi:hypothetical protein